MVVVAAASTYLTEVLISLCQLSDIVEIPNAIHLAMKMSTQRRCGGIGSHFVMSGQLFADRLQLVDVKFNIV